jgi:hypothetical protein
MPLAQVAVEIVAPADRPGRAPPRAELPDLREALLSACSDAARAQCVNRSGGPNATVDAKVTWEDATHVIVEVGTAGAPDERWSTRRLRFRAGDARIEKWRAVGYATGLLAGDLLATQASREGDTESTPAGALGDSSTLEGSQETPATGPDESSEGPRDDPAREAEDAESTEPQASDDPPEDSGPPAPPPPPRRWFVSAAAQGGPGLSRGSWKLGGVARGGLDFGGLFLTASFGYAERSRDDRGLNARWLTPAVGAGAGVPLGRFVLDARAEIAAEWLAADVEDPTTGASDSRSRVLGALRGGMEVAWRASDPLGIFVGAELTLRPAETDVVIRDEVFATARAVDYSGLAGFVAYFP